MPCTQYLNNTSLYGAAVYVHWSALAVVSSYFDRGYASLSTVHLFHMYYVCMWYRISQFVLYNFLSLGFHMEVLSKLHIQLIVQLSTLHSVTISVSLYFVIRLYLV